MFQRFFSAHAEAWNEEAQSWAGAAAVSSRWLSDDRF
jgi:hypothetical protein